MSKLPKIHIRNDRNLAFIVLGTKKIYLGKPGSPEALSKYGELVGHILEEKAAKKAEPKKSSENAPFNARPTLTGSSAAKQAKGLRKARTPMESSDQSYTLDSLLSDYLEFLKTNPKDNSRQISEVGIIQQKTQELFPGITAHSFGPKKLRLLRDYYGETGYYEGKDKTHRNYSRRQLNKVCKTVRRIYSWGVGEELVEVSDYHALKHCEPLRAGKCDAPEITHRTRQARRVTLEEVKAVCKYLLPTYADMVKILYIIGCRPQELCSMKWEDIDRSGKVWVCHLKNHKTAWKGKTRTIAFGRKCQSILKKYECEEGGYIFKPANIIKEEAEIRAANRKTPLWDSHKERNRRENTGAKMARARESVERCNFDKVVKRAVDKAIEAGELKERWTPYLLRHEAITEVREKYGAETTQHFAGHNDLETQKYYDHSQESTVIGLIERREKDIDL